MSEAIDLCEKRIDNLTSRVRGSFKSSNKLFTLRASLGSLPDMAFDRAEVNDSTSSTQKQSGEADQTVKTETDL